ncbi:TolB family protein [Gemmatimonas sp.]|uniref:TolB family protein n=1 Tax=Gemmatimonas sp. TaxID=1962908 RepID=UPI003983D912
MNSVPLFRRWSVAPTLFCTLGVAVPSRAVAQVTTAGSTAGLTARPAPPDPDVFLLPLAGRGDALKIGVPVNVSRRTGYDNQPAFARDSRALFFTSNRGDGQSDIYVHDVSTGLTGPLRATKPESEYSAMPTLDGQSITVIRVEADSTQRLAQFPTDGSAPRVLFPAIKPVGYFAQADDSTWAMFVLGAPATLRLARTGAGRELTTGDEIASNVGRSLHRIPGTAHVSYVQKGAAAWYVMRLDPASRRVDTLIALPTGSEDVAWVDSTTLLVGSGTQLMQWRRGAAAWNALGDLAFAQLTNITRLAVSPNGQWLALVAEPKARTATRSLR